MTALDMIREGATVWIDDTPGVPFSGLWLALALFPAGLALAALARVFWASFSRWGRTHSNPPHTTVFDAFPFPVWTTDTEPSAGNAAFEDIAPEISGVAAGSRARVEIAGETRWFSVEKSPLPNRPVKFAVPCDALVEAENSHARLMETLSTTFAHLPVGLAVFDANGTLNLFNPALCELLGLNPAWLASRPTLAAFLEKLHNNRNLPERRNFRVWRHRLTEMSATGDNADYREEWRLSDDLVLRVTGQAHRQGATAFLFENISAQVHVERLLHAESEVNQAVLDHMAEGILFLNGAGNMIFTNSAFDTAFGWNPESALPPSGIAYLQGQLPETAEVASLLDQIRDFISFPHRRHHWSIDLNIPHATKAELIPMPDGSLCVSFSGAGRCHTDNNVTSLLHFADAMFTTIKESTSMSDPLNTEGLIAFLRKREITLDLGEFSSHAAEATSKTKTRRILWYLVLAASNVCRDGGRISLISSVEAHSLTLTCTIHDNDILTGQSNHLSLGLLRQLVEQAGGGADWIFESNARPLTVSCALPIAREAIGMPIRAGHA